MGRGCGGSAAVQDQLGNVWELGYNRINWEISGKLQQHCYHVRDIRWRPTRFELFPAPTWGRVPPSTEISPVITAPVIATIIVAVSTPGVPVAPVVAAIIVASTPVPVISGWAAFVPTGHGASRERGM